MKTSQPAAAVEDKASKLPRKKEAGGNSAELEARLEELEKSVDYLRDEKVSQDKFELETFSIIERIELLEKSKGKGGEVKAVAVV